MNRSIVSAITDKYEGPGTQLGLNITSVLGYKYFALTNNENRMQSSMVCDLVRHQMCVQSPNLFGEMYQFFYPFCGSSIHPGGNSGSLDAWKWFILAINM